MSIIHVRQIEKFLSAEFFEKIDMSDIQSHSDNHLHILINRALSAFSIHLLTHVTIDDALSCLVDGADYNGINAIHLDKSKNRLYVVHSKWIASGKGEPDLGSVQNFANGITDLVNFKFDRFSDKINKQKQNIINALEDPSFRMSVVLVHTGVGGPAQHAMRDLDDLIESLNDANEIVELEVLTQTHLHRGLTARIQGDPQYSWS